MAYTILISRKADKELKSIPRNDAKRIAETIKQLSEEPFPYGSIKLQGSEDVYRIRQGNYRIIYTVENDVLIIEVLAIGHRKDIYR